MKVEKSGGASFEANKTDKVSGDKKGGSSQVSVDFSAGKNSKVNESAATDSYRAFALQNRFINSVSSSNMAVSSRAQIHRVADGGGTRANASAPSPLTFTSVEGREIPKGQAWLTAPGTVVPELAAQNLKESSGPQAFQQFIRDIDQHQTDADWLQRFYGTLGTADTARLMSEAPETWYTDSDSSVDAIRNSFNTLAENGKLNQTDLDNLLLSTAAPNSDLGSPSLFNGLTAGVFAELPNTASGAALKEMFVDSATRLAFGELRSPDQYFNARLDSFKNNFAAAATEVLGTAPAATQIGTLADLSSRGRLTTFTSMATQGYRPADASNGITSLGKLDQLLNTVASYSQTASNQAGVNLSELGVKMYNGVLLGMMSSRGQAAHNLSGNETFRQAVSSIFTRDQNQIATNYPQAQVDALAAAGGDKAYDGLYLGANNRLYFPGTPIAAIPGVRPSNGQEPVGKTIYVNGMNTDTATQAASLQAIADQSGMEVVGIRNSTEGNNNDLVQSILDKADIGVNPAVDALATAVYDEIKAGRTVHLIAHSQGGIITSRALHDVYGRLEAEGLSREQVEETLGKVEVETFAAAAWSYPDGPQYVHYINNNDGVPLAAGGGQVDVGPFDINLVAQFEPGRDAVVHRFAEDRGEWGREYLGDNHDFNNLYLGWRVPFAEARSPDFRAISEILDRSDNNRISEMRRDLNLTPGQIRDLAVTYQHSLLEGSGHGVPLEKFTNLSRTFNLSNVQTEELLRAIGSGSANPDGDIFMFMNQISRRPEFQFSSGGGELTQQEWKQGLANLISELRNENDPDRQPQIQSYQRVLDYLNDLPG